MLKEIYISDIDRHYKTAKYYEAMEYNRKVRELNKKEYESDIDKHYNGELTKSKTSDLDKHYKNKEQA